MLWIGYLKWQLRTVKADSIAEPVLHAYGTIREQDAILAYDKQELLRDDKGRPLSRWDGFTMKQHPITGEEIPDPDATVAMYRYENPRPAELAGSRVHRRQSALYRRQGRMRAELGDGYAEACWMARPKMPGGADYVMHFWDEAAVRLLRKPKKKGESQPAAPLRFHHHQLRDPDFLPPRIERHMKAKEPLSAGLCRSGPSLAEFERGQGGGAQCHDRRRKRPARKTRGNAGDRRAGERAEHGYAGCRIEQTGQISPT